MPRIWQRHGTYMIQDVWWRMSSWSRAPLERPNQQLLLRKLNELPSLERSVHARVRERMPGPPYWIDWPLMISLREPDSKPNTSGYKASVISPVPVMKWCIEHLGCLAPSDRESELSNQPLSSSGLRDPQKVLFPCGLNHLVKRLRLDLLIQSSASVWATR